MNSTLNSIKLQLILILIIILSILGCERQVVKEIMMNDDNRSISALPIDDIEITHPPESTPDDILIRVNGWFPNPCDYKHNETKVMRSQDGRKITINISMERLPSDPRYSCITATEPYHEYIDLGILSPGNYIVVANGISKSFRIE